MPLRGARAGLADKRPTPPPRGENRDFDVRSSTPTPVALCGHERSVDANAHATLTNAVPSLPLPLVLCSGVAREVWRHEAQARTQRPYPPTHNYGREWLTLRLANRCETYPCCRRLSRAAIERKSNKHASTQALRHQADATKCMSSRTRLRREFALCGGGRHFGIL